MRSPLTTWPLASVKMTRSASPSKEMPRSALCLRTSSPAASGMERAAAVVDVEAVGVVADGDDFGAEFLENERADEVGGAVSAIDDDFQAVEGNVVGGVFGELDVAAAGVVDAVGLADLRGRQRRGFGFVAHDVALDEGFEVVGELVAVRAEDFHAVVLVRIVGGGDHDAGDGSHRFRQVGDGGRGHGADEVNVHSHGNEAAGDGGFQHVAGNAGVLADEHAVAAGAVGAEDVGDGLAHAQGDLGGDREFVHAAADAVGSKKFHGVFQSFRG